MSVAHLLAVEIGPVASFIAAARKTRDLWFGSWLVSEVAKAAARAVRDAGGELIFPAAPTPGDLDPDSDLTVADVILASVPPGPDPAAVAAAAKAAAHAAWVGHATEARQGIEGFLRAEIWDDQTPPAVPPETAGEVVECYAAWVPLGDDYAAARRAVIRFLAGRTACRNFPAANGRAGVPKSSLDGARETVFRDLKPAAADRRASRLRLNRGELLDAPGVTKRLGGGRRPYPSVARVAADPWVRGAAKAGERFDRLLAACEGLAGEVLARIEVRAGGRLAFPQYAAFPFEGAALYPSRYAELAEEAGAGAADLAGLRAALAGLGEPQPYYALLAADGDRVGRVLDGCRTPAAHRDFSTALSAFAAEARGVVRDHSGAAVFVGGDDVLAFLPIDRAFRCAAGLHAAFGRAAAGLTLSVGVAVAHFLDPLEDVLAWARAAEHAAKDGLRPGDAPRNAIAVRHQPRGGSPVVVRLGWGDDPVARVHAFADRLRAGDLPDKVAYDLRRLADDYDPAVWPDGAETAAAVAADVARLLRRKAGRAGEVLAPHVQRVRSRADLIDLANTVILARRVAAAESQAEGRG